METLNDRIRLARKHLSLSQKDFADQLGLSQRSISWSEQSGNNVPDSTIKSICMAFSISEEWLRDGTGPMQSKSNSFDLTQYVLDRDGDPLELEIIKAYLTLPKDIRQAVLDHFKKCLSQSLSSPAPAPTVEELEEEYIKRHSASASTTASNVSSTTTDAEKAAGEQ